MLSKFWTYFLCPPIQVYHSEKLQEKKSWISAQQSCREIGAQLLSVSSVGEEHYVAHLLNKIFGLVLTVFTLALCNPAPD